ncbi:MAG TPA: ribonuclease T [Gammaproteobacteria bacterium]|nr:ribonuclease T [Gammaproteobacteria bacterium]
MSNSEKNSVEENRSQKRPIAKRFRSYLPVVVDVETAGFDARRDALLEVAAIAIDMDEDGILFPGEMHSCHIKPFEGANLDEAALKFTGIDPFHPLRIAQEESEALHSIFRPIRQAVKETGCTRAILVGHNPSFDLSFINAAAERSKIKRNPFHPFSTFDTATLGGLAFGQTVLARAAKAAKMEWSSDEAHSARYDTEKTAELFCLIVNQWDQFKK